MHVVINVRFEEPEYSGDEPNEMVEVCLIKDGENSINVQVTLTPEELTPISANGKIFYILFLNIYKIVPPQEVWTFP